LAPLSKRWRAKKGLCSRLKKRSHMKGRHVRALPGDEFHRPGGKSFLNSRAEEKMRGEKDAGKAPAQAVSLFPRRGSKGNLQHTSHGRDLRGY